MSVDSFIVSIWSEKLLDVKTLLILKLTVLNFLTKLKSEFLRLLIKKSMKNYVDILNPCNFLIWINFFMWLYFKHLVFVLIICSIILKNIC